MDLPYEKGVARHSELYDATPSALARELLHYLQRIGHFTCDTHYIVERDYMESYLLFYVLRGTMEVTSEGETVRNAALLPRRRAAGIYLDSSGRRKYRRVLPCHSTRARRDYSHRPSPANSVANAADFAADARNRTAG